MSPTLSSISENLQREEQRQALRHLLLNPMTHANHDKDDDFRLILRHRLYLQEWFAKNLGWRLMIEQDFARLHKRPADLKDTTRPARLPGAGQGTALTRRSYALFCLTAAALEKLDNQTDLTRLTEQLMALIAMDPLLSAALPLDFSLQAHRSELISAIRLFELLRILVRVDGDDQQFLLKKGDALYTVRKPLLARLLNVQQSPSVIQATDIDHKIKLMMQEVEQEHEDEARDTIRKYLMRRLLDDPVLYYDELSAEQLAYLHSQRSTILRILIEATGLHPETRKEGIALVDPESELSDVWMPEEGTEGHCTLLLAEYFSKKFRESGPEALTSRHEVEQKVLELTQTYAQVWRKDTQRPGAETELTTLATDRLLALRLIQYVPEIGYRALPAISRYRVQEAEISSSKDTDSPSAKSTPRKRGKTSPNRTQQQLLFTDFD